MSTLKERVLNVFLDNIVSDISPGDMRYFVNSIFDTKENSIRKLSKITDITRVFPNPIIKHDIAMVYEDGEYNGIYLVMKNSPQVEDLMLMSGNAQFTAELETLADGLDNQVLSIQDGSLVWIYPEPGYKILGTKNIRDILLLKPSENNVIYIAQATDQFAGIPGIAGDGYSWNDGEWTNIGPIRGPEGEEGTSSGEPSQLEKVFEDGKWGWRLLEKNPNNYGNIGDKAIDLSHSSLASEIFGATGNFSLAVGEDTTASHSHSFVTGKGNRSSNAYQTVVGRYNVVSIGTLFEVGSGDSDAIRRNALEVYETGEILAPSLTPEKITNDYSLVTKKYIDDLIIDAGNIIK